jgi:flagellar L-ring protein precursor FlgH
MGMLSKKLALIMMFGLLTCAMNVFANSLYSDSQYFPLHADKKTMAVGHIITVLIYEQASASTSAGTDTERETSVSGSIGRTNSTSRRGLDLNSDFSGGGSVNREGQLIASVSATIEQISSDGIMFIAGKQLINFNDEKQIINLSGNIRLDDVSVDNTVLSTRIANAEITYTGDGLLGKEQKPGVITRVFRWLF